MFDREHAKRTHVHDAQVRAVVVRIRDFILDVRVYLESEVV